MKEKDFSKGILKYALQNGITHNELSANYKDLTRDHNTPALPEQIISKIRE